MIKQNLRNYLLIGLVTPAFVACTKTNSNYKVQLSEFDYKFQVSTSAAESEMEHFKKRVAEAKTPSALDLSSLADLYLSEAKKTGMPETYARAEQLAQQALQVDPKSNNAQKTLIKIMIARHQFSEALAKIEMLFGSGFSEAASSERAVIYMAVSRFAEALEQITYLISIKPDSGSATLKALVLGHLGQDELSLHYFKRSLQLEDLNEELQSVFTRAQFAQFLVKKGNYEQALALCDSALKIIPESPFVQFVRTQAFIAQKNYSEGKKAIEMAFAASKEPVYLLNMIYIAKLMKNDADFKVLSEQALKIYKTEVESSQYGHLVDLANLHYVMGNYEVALKVALQNRALRKTLRSELSLAKTYLKLGKPNLARPIIEAEIANGSTEVELPYLMLEILKGEKDQELREIFKNKIASQNPNFNEEILMVIP